MATKSNLIYGTAKDLFNAYTDYLTANSYANTASNFDLFLADNNLSNHHASELLRAYNAYISTNKAEPKISTGDFKMRKSHPKRDAFVKKGVVPATITAGAIGGTIGAISASSLVAGASFGFLPVFSNPALTAIAAGTVGAGIGIVATPVYFVAKRAITKGYYKARYKSAERNLEEYENGASIDDLRITQLIEKIEDTTLDIYKLKDQAWYHRLYNWPVRLAKNTINRNRIHHLEKYTKDLVKLHRGYSEALAIAENNGDTESAKRIKKSMNKAFDLLDQVDDFVGKNVEISKIHAMLNCDQNGKHVHNAPIENVDIFASLKIYVDALENENLVKPEATAKKQVKNLATKKTVATNLINGERLISKMIKVVYIDVDSISTDTNNITITAGGSTYVFNNADIDASKVITQIARSGKKIIINYNDGTTATVTPKRLKTPTVEEVSIRTTLLDKLQNDTYFINELKADGFRQNTINALVASLENWLSSPEEKFRLAKNTRVFHLYNEAIDKLTPTIAIAP